MIDGAVKVSEISEFLEVKETTVKKWFAGKLDYHCDMAFVNFGEFLEFLGEYRNGYYTERIIERYNIDDHDDDGIRQVFNVILSNCRLYVDVRVFGEDDDELLNVIKPKGIEAKVVFM